MSIDPPSASVVVGGQKKFSAFVSGTSNTKVTWQVKEKSGGSINSDGLYTAPNIPGTYHIVAISQADSTKSGEASVVVIKIDTKALTKDKEFETSASTARPGEDLPPKGKGKTAMGHSAEGTNPLDCPRSGGRAFIRPEERPELGG